MYGGWCSAGEYEFIIHRQGINETHHTEVYPDSVGQYIGKKDKNGKKLYSGCKVKFFYKNYNKPTDKLQMVECEIVFSDKGAWALKWKDGYINNAPLNCEKYELIE